MRMTLDTICDDKEDMEVVIEAFTEYIGLPYSIREMSQKIVTVKDRMIL